MKRILVVAMKIALWGILAVAVVLGLMLLSEAKFDPATKAAIAVIFTLGLMIYQLGRGIDRLQRTVAELRAEVRELRRQGRGQP